MGPSRRVLLLAPLALAAGRPARAQSAGMSAVTAYAFTFGALNGGAIRLSDYAGRPVLIVNTASFCGFANQLSGLQALWTSLGPRGLAVIGVPSNDFGGQEPGAPAETRQIATEHGVSFPLAEKTVVVGANAHPFYKWAAAQRPRDVPRWNFHKYLVSTDGRLVAAFGTTVEPGSPTVLAAIERELTSA